MKLADIVDLQLELLFGNSMPVKVQALVDAELNEGKWVDGYDIAVKSTPLDSGEGHELLEVVLKHFPEARIDTERLMESVDEDLPQGNMCWLVAPDMTYILSDSLRVSRYVNADSLWVTPRISIDGIILDSIDERFVKGRSWWMEGDEPNDAFTLCFESGEVLKGRVADWSM